MLSKEKIMQLKLSYDLIFCGTYEKYEVSYEKKELFVTFAVSDGCRCEKSEKNISTAQIISKRSDYSINWSIITKMQKFANDIIFYFLSINGVCDVKYSDVLHRDIVKVINYNEDFNEDIREYHIINLDIFVQSSNKIIPLNYTIRFEDYSEILAIVDDIEAVKALNVYPFKEPKSAVVFKRGTFGYVIHESIGHMLECDCYKKYEVSKKYETIIKNSKITVVDDPVLRQGIIQLHVDDQGNLTKKKILISNGKIKDYLTFANCSTKKGENARRQSFRYKALPRMSNTFMLPGECTINYIDHKIQNGIIVNGCSGGYVNYLNGEVCLFVNNALVKENGSIKGLFAGSMLYSNITEILNNVFLIGNDSKFAYSMCKKEGQGVVVSTGAPTVVLKEMTVL